VGVDTIRTLIQAEAGCLAIEEKKTLLLDRSEVVAMADRANLAIVVL